MDRNFAVFIVWIITCLASFARVDCATPIIPAVELDALVQFKLNYIAKASAQQLLWSWDTSGNASTSVCESWVGIACTTTASGFHIHSINLGGFGLEGSIAPHLGNLTFLSTLNLSSNAFTGTVPSALTGCTSLQVLDLQWNSLSSPISPSLTSLPLLEILGLCGNNFSGPIPSGFFTNVTASLRGLSLCNNTFTGSLPPDLGLHVPNLQYLLLLQNNLTGSIPPSLGNCSGLHLLQLHLNKFTGPIPAELGMLHNLQALYLYSNELTGAIPPILGNCTSLRDLKLSFNNLTGSIPTELGLRLGDATTIYVGGNRLTGAIPRSIFTNCSSLQDFELSQNLLSGVIWAEVGLLRNLRRLLLGENSFTGVIPSSIVNCTSMVILYLGHNQLTGSIPADLGLYVPNLQYLLLWENKLTGSIPPSLGNCTNLGWLQLQFNEFTGPIPGELGMLHNLQLLELSSNQLTGAIPLSLGNCTSLRDLELADNNLTGSIPTQLGLLGDVVTMITAFGNKLTGSLPRSIFTNCSSLQSLEFSGNLLSGVIWEEVGLLGNLRELLLGKNSFTGLIPSSIVNCTSMVTLDLGHNQLIGSIPASMSMLGELDWLNLGFNHLSGLLQHVLDFNNFTKMTRMSLGNNQFGGSLMPINFSKLQQIHVLYINNNQFTGEIPWHSLVNCTFLFALDLSNNKLSGAIPSTLGRYRWLQFLDLHGNLLWGAIPDFAEFNKLQLLDLDLSFNNLNGSLPSSLAHALLTVVDFLDLSYNHFSGSLPPWLGQLVKAQGMDLSHNNFTGSIPASLGDCLALITLSLSNNHLSGDLPLQLGSLTYLQILDLSHNNLSGVLPSFLGSKLLQLQMLNVSFNNFRGPIPTSEGVFKHLTASSFQGNPGLCGELLNKTCTEDVEVLQKQHHHHSLLQLKNWRGILLCTFVSALVLIGLVFGWHRCFFQPVHQPVDVSRSILAQKVKRYTAKDLLEATQGYSEDNLLGKGGLGVVYKGVLSDGQVVAIKKLKDIYNGSEESLLKEMHILSKMRHRNLVQILGCVLNLDIKALVLQYMENGSLEQYLDMHIQAHINEESEQKALSSLRYLLMVNRVAMGIAHALDYLHHGYGEAIIHGDVKPGNILLDSDLEPHLADFGLAKLIRTGAEAVSLTSDLRGSIGYMAPEYAYAARVTTKVDVYSFGVVVLRMLTGKSPEQMVTEGESLHEWVKSKLASAEGAGGDSVSWEELLDAALVPKMAVNKNASEDERGKQIVDKESMRRLLHVGLVCTSNRPEDRPTIHQVLTHLTSQNTATLDTHLNLEALIHL